jgi:hypoxanthine phosphoribosyltransferase
MINIQQILFDEQTIIEKVRELAERISKDYAGKEVVLICILKGAAVFSSDLIRHISVPVMVDYVQAASYGLSTTSSRNIIIKKDIETDLGGKHVLLVDTIVDTGETMDYLLKKMREKGPASLRTVAFLDKRSRRLVNVQIDYLGFEIPDKFVVGYGMDCQEKYRNLPSIAVVMKSEG